MICIGKTRLQKMMVGDREIIHAYLGGSGLDLLPYLFAAPKEIYFNCLVLFDGNIDIEANNDWQVTQKQ